MTISLSPHYHHRIHPKLSDFSFLSFFSFFFLSFFPIAGRRVVCLDPGPKHLQTTYHSNSCFPIYDFHHHLHDPKQTNQVTNYTPDMPEIIHNELLSIILNYSKLFLGSWWDSLQCSAQFSQKNIKPKSDVGRHRVSAHDNIMIMITTI
jgi:hypothetical protein